MKSANNVPLTDVDTVDVVGVRKDGGLDLVISVSDVLDDSEATLQLLQGKLQNYISAADNLSFLKHYGKVAGTRVTVHISCEHRISSAATKVIEEMRKIANAKNVDVFVRKQME